MAGFIYDGVDLVTEEEFLASNTGQDSQVSSAPVSAPVQPSPQPQLDEAV